MPKAPAVTREAEEDWRSLWRRGVTASRFGRTCSGAPFHGFPPRLRRRTVAGQTCTLKVSEAKRNQKSRRGRLMSDFTLHPPSLQFCQPKRLDFGR